MDDPETGALAVLTPTHAASQRSAAAPPRPRGPHPLPLFLATVTQVCAGDPQRLEQVLAGLRRYQAAPPATARAPRAVIAQIGNVALRDHGGDGPVVVVVPSLINPPTVLDLASGNSLLDALAARGLRVLMVDWGTPEPLALATLVETRLAPLLAALGQPLALAGYCLGGTLAVAAAALLGDRVTRLALLAAPWHFAGYGAERERIAAWWQHAEPLAQALGAVPMDLLQPAFWGIDPAGLAAKYARFATLPEGAATTAFLLLEDWSNSGPPLALAAARDLSEQFFRDDLTGRGHWRVAGDAIDPAALGIPILDIIAARDRIVPPAAAMSAGGPGTPLAVEAGHVGMVVGSRAPALLWHPLADWLHG